MMMPSITAMPNSAINPIAADTLNGIPDIKSPSTPPKIAIGITLMASSVSTIEPKLNHSSTAISARLIGTTIDSRLIASCRLPNSPTHSTRDPGGSLTWAATLSCASRTALPVFRGKPDDNGKVPVAAGFIEITGAVATDRHLDRGIDIPRRQPVTGRARPIDIDLDGGLAKRSEHRQIGNPLYRGKDRLDLVGGVGERLQVVAKQFDRVLPLYSRYGFRNVVLQILREIEFDAGEFILQFPKQSSRQLFLVMGIGPFVDRLQRRKEFRIEKPGGIGAIVGAAMLRHHRFDLGKAADHPAHLVDIGIALLQRDRRRQGRTDPEIALFEFGKKLQ